MEDGVDIGPVDEDMADMDEAMEEAMEGMKVAPYREYQNRNFLHKFGQWLDEQLIELDMKLGNMGTMHEAGVANAEDESEMMAMNMAEESLMASNAAEAMLKGQADNLLDGFASFTAVELGALRDARPIAEAAAISAADELKKQVIYNVFVLSYANDGEYSHYVPKGPNGLTGLDILDAKSYDDFPEPGLIYDHGYGYAQVANDEHAMTLTEALEAGKSGFDEMIQ
jgi:hypothetical protein